MSAYSTALPHKDNASVDDLELSQCTLVQSLRLSHALEYGNGGLRWLICELRNDAADMFGDVSWVICCVCVVAPGEDRTCARAALRELYVYWLLSMLRSALGGQATPCAPTALASCAKVGTRALGCVGRRVRFRACCVAPRCCECSSHTIQNSILLQDYRPDSGQQNLVMLRCAPRQVFAARRHRNV